MIGAAPKKWKIQCTPETKDIIEQWFISEGGQLDPEVELPMIYYAKHSNEIMTNSYILKTCDSWPEITFEDFEKWFLTDKQEQ